jgi:hypothetical protein
VLSAILDGEIDRPTGVVREAEWEGVRKGTLLSSEALESFKDTSEEAEGFLEAYETEFKGPVHKFWWIDPRTNRLVVIAPSGEHHDVDRRLGMVFAVSGKGILGAKIAGDGDASSLGKVAN